MRRLVQLPPTFLPRTQLAPVGKQGSMPGLRPQERAWDAVAGTPRPNGEGPELPDRLSCGSPDTAIGSTSAFNRSDPHTAVRFRGLPQTAIALSKRPVSTARPGACQPHERCWRSPGPTPRREERHTERPTAHVNAGYAISISYRRNPVC